MNRHIPLAFTRLDEPEMLRRARAFYERMRTRRSVRHFSPDPVPLEVIEYAIRAASTAPSGANKQPWSFCIVRDPTVKRQIRQAAEREEYLNYHQRMSPQWLQDLQPLGTDWHKPFLEIAPYLIVVFKRVYEIVDGEKRPNYYVNESVGIACGMLLAALHESGLATLTHTPSPMRFLEKILHRPPNERAFLLIPTGYPADDAQVPDIRKKSFDEVCTIY